MYLTKKRNNWPSVFGCVLQPGVAPAVQTAAVSCCKWRNVSFILWSSNVFLDLYDLFFPSHPKLCCPAPAGRRSSSAPLPAVLQGAMGFQLSPGSVNSTGDTAGNGRGHGGCGIGTWHKSQMIPQEMAGFCRWLRWGLPGKWLKFSGKWKGNSGDFLGAQPCKPYSTPVTPSVSVYKAELAYIKCIRNTRLGYGCCSVGTDGEEEIQIGLSIWEEMEGFPSPAEQNARRHPIPKRGRDVPGREPGSP